MGGYAPMSKTKFLCDKCGREYSENDKFCAFCGSPLGVQKHQKRKHLILWFSIPVILGVVLWIGVFSDLDVFRQAVSGDAFGQTVQTIPSVTEDIRDTLLDQFVFTSFVPNDTENTDGFWAYALLDSKNVLVGLDKDLHYLCALDAEQYEVYDGPYDGYSLGTELGSGRSIILDSEQKDVTARYVDTDTNGSVLSLYRDETGVTVWTCEIIGGGESLVLMVYAKDIWGNTKYAWNLSALLETQGNPPPMPSGGNTYIFARYILNVATGQMFDLELVDSLAGGEYSVLGMDNEEETIFIKSQTETETNLVIVSLSFGTASQMSMKKGSQIGPFCNGVCYVHGILTEDSLAVNGVLDVAGNYTQWPETDREYAFLPEFRKGYALVELENENGESVVTLLDKEGEMLFEPIPGTAIPSVVPGQEEITVFSCVDYPIMTDRGKESLNLDGSTTLLEEGSVFHTLSVTKCGKNYYRIADGKLFADYTLKEELTLAN